MIDLTQADRPPTMETVSTMLLKKVPWLNQVSPTLRLHCGQQSKAWSIYRRRQATMQSMMMMSFHLLTSPSLRSKQQQNNRRPRQQNDDCGPSSEHLLLSALCQCAPMMLARRSTSCLRIGVRLGREAREETDRDLPKRPEVESDVLWLSDEPLSWEALAAQAVKGRGELNLRELSVQERALVDEAKRTEWSTMEETGSVVLLTGQISQDVQREFPHRFVDSRFVLTKKVEDGAPVRFQGSLVLAWSQGSRCHEGSPRK